MFRDVDCRVRPALDPPLFETISPKFEHHLFDKSDTWRNLIKERTNVLIEVGIVPDPSLVSDKASKSGSTPHYNGVHKTCGRFQACVGDERLRPLLGSSKLACVFPTAVEAAVASDYAQ